MREVPALQPSRRTAPVNHQLAKALLIDTTSGESFPVMYNPEELKLEQGNTVAEVPVPGLNTPPSQYVRGKARVLTMELFFDSYEEGEDVRRHTTPIVRLLDTQPSTQAPPVLLFSMGRLQMRCVLVDAGQRFTMFLRDGTPVRSTLSIRLQEHVEIELEVRRGLFFGSPTASAAVNALAAAGDPGGPGTAGARVHVTVSGDTLSALAGAYLGDPAQWRALAQANRLDDPFDLPVGRPLVIPASGTSGAPRSGGRS